MQQGYRTGDPESRVGTICNKIASDAANSPNVRMRRVHLVVFVGAGCHGERPVLQCAESRSRVRGCFGAGTGLGGRAADRGGCRVASTRPDAGCERVYGREWPFFDFTCSSGPVRGEGNGNVVSAFIAGGCAGSHQRGCESDLNTLYEAMQWLPSKPRTGDDSRTTGFTRSARPLTGRCCAGLRTDRWWW